MFSTNAQNLTAKNGAVSFPTIADYEYFADNPNARASIDNFVNTNGTITTLKNASATDTGDVIPEFLLQVLNTDNIVAIGSFYVKIDFVNSRGLVISSTPKNSYQHLVNNNLSAAGIMVFTMEDGNALEIMEGIENGSASVANYKDLIVKHTEEMPITTSYINGPSDNFYEEELFSCGNPDSKELKRFEQWGTAFGNSSCPAPGNNNAKHNADLKVVYQKAIIYFSLISKEKCQIVCLYGGSPILATPATVYMYLSGTAKYKRCGWSERIENHTSGFSSTNEKSWRPFESSRRLEKFDFTVQFNQAQTLNAPTNFAAMNIKAGY